MEINIVIIIRKENMKMIKGIEVLVTNNIYTCVDWCIIGFAISLVISIIFTTIFIIERKNIFCCSVMNYK